jgi:tetratricopeptide (TPR) repeat protein
MRRSLGRAVRVGVALAIAAGICGGCRTAGPPSAFTSTAKTSMSGGSQVESTDPALRESLARIALLPSAAAHRDAAAAYLRLGIRDKAYDHLERAVELDPKDAPAYDGLARLWRDWGFPEHGLTDAQRAVKYAPASPIVFNTLGTLYEAMGLQHEAKQAYWRAVEIDSHAEYALANLTRMLTVQLSEARRAETPAPADAMPKSPTPKKETP